MTKIRLKQINQNELYNYVTGIASSFISNLPSVNLDNPIYLDYNYSKNSSNLNEKYFNIFDSTENITGNLPTIQNKKKFLIKNINVGMLTILPSGNQKIDGFNDLKLLSGQSAELIAISGSNFTGWLSIDTNGGLS
jgi:hypothetical protein